MSIARSTATPARPFPGQRIIGVLMLIVALALLSSCGEDIGSTANPDTTDEPSPGSGEGNNEQPDEGQGNDQGNDPGNNEGNNESEGEPSGGSTGEFTLSMPTTLALVEGSGGITVNLVVNRQSGHNRTIELALEGAQPADNSQLEYAFSPPTLSGTDSVSALTLAVRIGAAPILQQQRNLRLSANDGVTTRELVIDLAVEPVAAPDVYLLIGQSNMVGFSLGGEKQTGPGEPDEPLARIRQLNVTGNDSQNFGDEAAFTDPSRLVAFPRFVTAEDPLHESYDPSIDGKSGTFIGLGLSFAKRALGSTERDIILVPSAWSGTGFCNNGLEHIAWNADTPDPSSDWLGGTALHDRALARINIALEETGGILRGILWHQGEADANESACANDYAANLRALIASLRTRIQIDARGPDARGADALLPFVLGTMSRGDDERGTFSEFDPFKTTVDLVHRTLPTEVPGVAVTNNDDLVPDAYPCGQGSCIHFGAAAYREMGRRYFEELQALWTAADS